MWESAEIVDCGARGGVREGWSVCCFHIFYWEFLYRTENTLVIVQSGVTYTDPVRHSLKLEYLTVPYNLFH